MQTTYILVSLVLIINKVTDDHISVLKTATILNQTTVKSEVNNIF